MKNLKPVNQLTKESIKLKVSTLPGIYRWWFDREGTQILLYKMSMSINDPKIKTQNINGHIYYALYFGISKNLRERIKWHALQKHTHSAVNHGTLSTLRQSLCALLDEDMVKAEIKVNDFIKKHCYWEWEENVNPALIEKQELSSNEYYYPLNIQENRSLPKQYINTLKELRKKHKK